MTSLRQIQANRRNALRSTGPTTEAGKERSRRNAVRHGLCAETVIGGIEPIEDYRAFEAAVIADYEAQTAVEREANIEWLRTLDLVEFFQENSNDASSSKQILKSVAGPAPDR